MLTEWKKGGLLVSINVSMVIIPGFGMMTMLGLSGTGSLFSTFRHHCQNRLASINVRPENIPGFGIVFGLGLSGTGGRLTHVSAPLPKPAGEH
ncbi:hypothetical protein [Lactiplantibacillus carotarum]|uniref:hypothetical protein n=1 Tax=Lactiplantibacillus carotarum TaxID=2993456 RepID=UPI00298F16F3|nr:hypothetical protein [Lactiplantibacillus carotarum]